MASGAKTSKKQRANFIGFMRKKVEQKRKRADFWKKYAEKHPKKTCDCVIIGPSLDSLLGLGGGVNYWK